jgi:dihydrofolate reductase
VEPCYWDDGPTRFVVLGSGQLAQSLMRRNLIDQYVLLIHPLILGSGRRLFTDGSSFATLRLVDTKTTTSGVVIATYRPAGVSGAEDHRTIGTVRDPALSR